MRRTQGNQNAVGLTPGSSIYAPVTIDVTFSAVPEPSTWAMLLIGFAGLGIAAHRRRAKFTTQ